MKVQETGFVEFVTTLIGETVDAVVSSQIDQEKKYMDLKQDLFLSNEEMIYKYDLKNKALEVLGNDVNEEDFDAYLNDYIDNHKAVLKQYFEKNSVKVIVDRGKVSAKLIFSFAADEDESDDKTEASGGATGGGLVKPPIINVRPDIGRVGRITTPSERILVNKLDGLVLDNKNLISRGLISKGKKMIVRPVDVKNKDMLDLKTDIVSNVEFSFRTIID